MPPLDPKSPTELDGRAKGAEPSAPDPLVGQVVSDRYRVDRLLGVGGMGSVYRAEHVHMKKSVALKVLHQEMTYVPEAVARFEREAIAAARIEHPNVVAARDFGRLPEGSFYLALEFVEGKSLRTELDEQGTLPPTRALGIARQITMALSAAHAEGIVHRDLKPDNVMLVPRPGQGDFVKVLDFGIAKLPREATGESELTQLGAVFGTPHYMSPEQAKGDTVGPASDLYTAGVMLYEMLCGDTPFQGDAYMVVLTQHLTAPVPALPDGVPRTLSDLVMKLLAKDPSNRPASAGELLAELDAVSAKLAESSPRAAALSATDLLETAGSRGMVIARAVYVQTEKLWTLTLPHVLRAVRFGATHTGRLWRRAVTRFPRLGVFSRTVALGQEDVRLGAVAVGALLVGLTGTLVLVALSGSDDQAATSGVRPEPASDGPAPAHDGESEPKPIHDARRVDDVTLQDLLALPVFERTPKDWLTLGQGHTQREQWSESVGAYRNAIQADKALRSNILVLRGIRRAAEELSAYEAALNVAINLLGDEGMDLSYDLWRSIQDDSKKRLIAQTAYKKLEILHLRRGSKALRIRLGLEFAGKDCEKVKRILDDAMIHADERSVPLLEALHGKDGCGASGTRDCYPCIRERGDDIELAIETARETKAPRSGG